MHIELYKVRKIHLSLQYDLQEHLELSSEFGVIVQDEGVIFLETHIFDDDSFSKIFDSDYLWGKSKATMITFGDLEVEMPFMALTDMSTEENKIRFKCFDYILVKKEDPIYEFQKQKNEEVNPSELIKVDFWGLDLLVPPNDKTSLMVNDVPFEIKFSKGTEMMYATFPYNKEVVHNVLTLELFELFRESLVGYLSLINGARVQIAKEYYNGFIRLYSYNRIDNISRSQYACGNVNVFRPHTLLIEFDNYVRWNKILNLNKFVSHLCTAQQIKDYEDRSFILILALEGLCKKYIEIQDESRVPDRIISSDTFNSIKESINEILESKLDSKSTEFQTINQAINNLNVQPKATLKFRIMLEDVNISLTSQLRKLIRGVRSTLVHEAELKSYSDYVMLSELIREIILRLIDSKVERYSRFKEPIFSENTVHLSFNDYVIHKKLKVMCPVAIIPEEKSRMMLQIKCSPIN